MWHGIGVSPACWHRAVVWQAIRLANINIEVGVTPAMITAALAMLLVIFVIIRFLVTPALDRNDGEFRTFWAWIGLALAIIVAVGAWMNMQAAGESFRDVRDKVSSMTASEARAARQAAPRRPLRRRPHPPAAPPASPGTPAEAAGPSRAARGETRQTLRAGPLPPDDGVSFSLTRLTAAAGAPAPLDSTAWPSTARCGSRRASPRCSRAA